MNLELLLLTAYIAKCMVLPLVPVDAAIVLFLCATHCVRIAAQHKKDRDDVEARLAAVTDIATQARDKISSLALVNTRR